MMPRKQVSPTEAERENKRRLKTEPRGTLTFKQQQKGHTHPKKSKKEEPEKKENQKIYPKCWVL